MPHSSFDYQAVPGDYQYRAMREGPRMQRFWHSGKLAALDRWVIPGIDSRSDLALEVGCGSGNLICHIGARAAHLAALDVSRTALEFTAARLAQLRGPGGGAVQAVGESIPLRAGCAGWVVLSEVVEHLADPRTLLSEAWRVLRPGGRMFLTTPNERSLWPFMEKIVDFLNLAPKMAGEQHLSRYTPDLLAHMLQTDGWQVERLASFYVFSPFAALVSLRLAQRLLASELSNAGLSGMLLAVVARKPEQAR